MGVDIDIAPFNIFVSTAQEPGKILVKEIITL